MATDQFSLIAAPLYMPVHINNGPTTRSGNVPKFRIGRIRYVLQRTAPKSVHKPLKQRVVFEVRLQLAIHISARTGKVFVKVLRVHQRAKAELFRVINYYHAEGLLNDLRIVRLAHADERGYPC